MVISSTVFDLDIVYSNNFLTVVVRSNTFTQLGRFGLISVVSYDLALCNSPYMAIVLFAR